MENKMFCFQCQETAGCKGCTQAGVCGKSPEVAGLQDLLIYVSKGLSAVTVRLRNEGQEVSPEVNHLLTLNLFVTITNANFDREAIASRIEESLQVKASLLSRLADRQGLPEAALWEAGKQDFAAKAGAVGILFEADEDLRSLKELITYGLKGLSAYLHHANVLGQEDESLDAFQQETLAALLDKSLGAEELTALALKTGEQGVKAMALLDKANTAAFGNPELTKVELGVRPNPGILISGHDLRDLEMLLEQTEGTGVDVYTHGEMLPAHYYPKFKKYKHFAGNYGNAWWQQKEEFEAFNGPILLTTNCLVPPRESYKSRLFTTGAVGFPGCPHIEAKQGRKDFGPLIELAKKCQPPRELERGQIVGGFAHEQVTR